MRIEPAEQFAAAAVSNECQDSPAVSTSPDTAHIRGPALVRPLGHRDSGLDPWPETDGSLAHLPALELENSLYGVLVHAEQVRDGAVTERRVLFDHLLYWFGKVLLNLRRGLCRAIVDTPARHFEPPTELADRDVDSVGPQSLVDRLDHLSSSPSRDCNFFRARNSSMASP